jgi:hypothetical protein
VQVLASGVVPLALLSDTKPYHRKLRVTLQQPEQGAEAPGGPRLGALPEARTADGGTGKGKGAEGVRVVEEVVEMGSRELTDLMAGFVRDEATVLLAPQPPPFAAPPGPGGQERAP